MQSMVEMLNIPQIYGTQYHDHQIHHEYHTTKNNNNNNNSNNTLINNQILNEKSYYQSLKSNTKTITSSLTSTTPTPTPTATAKILKEKKTYDNHNIKGGGGGGRGAVLTDIYASLSSLQSIKSPTHYIEKFINLDLFKNYERLKLSNKYLPTYGSSLSAKSLTDNVFYKKVPQQQQQQQEEENHQEQEQDHIKQSKISVNAEDNTLKEVNCVQSKNRHKYHIDTDVAGIYESVRFNVQHQLKPTTADNMINKCSHNFLAENVQTAPAATLQNFQKLPECDQDLPKESVSSGPSSFTSDINSDNPIYRHLHMPSSTSPNKRNPIERITKNGSVRIYVDACPIYSQAPQNANESVSKFQYYYLFGRTESEYRKKS